MRLECIIDGELHKYDAASSKSLEEAIENHKHAFDYIGSNNYFLQDGNIQKLKHSYKYHFFRYKEKITETGLSFSDAIK